MDQQVVQCLAATLLPQENVRSQAESQLRELFGHPEAGLILARITLAQEVELAQRQSAAILLRKYVQQHWDPSFVTYQEPVCHPDVKAQIRPVIFSGLSDAQRKIRTACAFALSQMAKADWPDESPTLLSDLLSLLRSSNSDSVHGAMRVISEFVRNDLSEDQLLPVAREMLPALLSILGNPASHSPSTRASTVSVFRQVLRTLETVREEHPQAVTQALTEIVPVWLSAFQTLLAIDPTTELGNDWDALMIRIEIFRTLTFFQSAFSKALSPHVETFIICAVDNLEKLLPTFEQYYLCTTDEALEPPSSSADDDAGQSASVESLGCAILDYLTPTVRTPKAKSVLVDENKIPKEMLQRIVNVTVAYTRVTRENEEEWMVDHNAFVADEDEESDVYGLRVTGHDLIGSLIDKWPKGVAQILQALTQQRIQQSSSQKLSGNPDWWKPMESALAVVGAVSDDLRMLLEDEEDKPSYDLGYLFDSVVPGLLTQNETPFLQGRAFVFASHFAASLPPSLAQSYLDAAVDALASDGTAVPVKLSAVKTIKNFCRFVKEEVIRPHSARIVQLLVPLLQQTTEDTLYLTLETIRAVLGLHKELLDTQSASELANRVLEVWAKYTDDPVLTAIVEELYEAVTSLPDAAVVASFVDRSVPVLAQLIAEPVTEDTLAIPSAAMELVNSMLRSRNAGFEQSLVEVVAPAVLTCLHSTDDMDSIQHGCIYFTLIIRKDCQKLLNWRDASGRSGIDNILGLLARLLAPTFSESGGLFVGDLVIHLLRKAGSSIEAVLPELLRALVVRLTTAQTPSFKQSLVLPFAYLFSTPHYVETLELLENVQVDTSAGQKRALDVVIPAWCETADMIHGFWNVRVSNVALAQLFMAAPNSLASITVKGDQIIDEASAGTIMTRSKTRDAPHRFSEESFPLKTLKLLLREIQTGEPSASKGTGRADVDVDEDDGDDEWDDDDPLGSAEIGEFDFLSSFVGSGMEDDEDKQHDDEDLRADPISQIDMAGHLSNTLRQAYTSNTNDIHGLAGNLTEQEKGVLRAVLTVG